MRGERIDTIDPTGLPIKIDIEHIDQYSPEDFTRARRNGLGGSDSSILVGLNPYDNGTIEALVESKVRTTISQEEKEIGENRNVQAGSDLEPVIIARFNQYFPQYRIFKPQHMYRFIDVPYLTMNFDGAGYNVENDLSRYMPIEIKFVSVYGRENYDFTRAWWTEWGGFTNIGDLSQQNADYKTRADFIGIPPYYYSQLNQEMAALNAPQGLLAVLDETTWKMAVFRSRFDAEIMADIIKQGARVWSIVEAERAKLGLTFDDYSIVSRK